MNLEMFHEVTDQLIDFLTLENQLLKDFQGPEVSKLSIQKEDLVYRYIRLKTWIVDNRRFIQALPPMEKDNLHKKTLSLTLLAEENEIRLERLNITSQKFLKKLHEAMNRSARLTNSYTARGTKADRTVPLMATITSSLTFDQSL
ncbi:hypothetical protein [Candidatus Nucleicultrix amoebiphila]|jgi:hypothetical protein|uniref:Flagellar biosynthesis protein FlgN n=1 Tax=Candidatus Nucleicultrix amoebiphila FS5 TaxID=1414854 RepID=A0A1W6N419_9PROT|nr:hypothetical protein [Candidatus Nucleicultrix amoebiphila]ARN84526.1 hypothetical protein GQ61_03405 [Candidatus Nucleicultrix amoebiphila FS5]